MPYAFLVPAGMSLLGGLLGSEEKTTGKTNPTSQTTTSSGSHGSSTQNKIDPRMEQAIYGAGGIMPNASAWYMQNQSGLNDKMVTGMNNQWNQLGASSQGFNQMQNLGMGLMGGGAAGNPFTGGGGIAPQQMSYKPAEFNAAGGFNPFSMPSPTPMAAAMPAGAASGGGGGGGGGESGGVIGDALNQVSAAMAASGAAGASGYWFDDESGQSYWQPTSGGGGGGGSADSGYSKQTWSPAPTYQFNNGYTAYGADGSSASNPSGGGA